MSRAVVNSDAARLLNSAAELHWPTGSPPDRRARYRACMPSCGLEGLVEDVEPALAGLASDGQGEEEHEGRRRRRAVRFRDRCRHAHASPTGIVGIADRSERARFARDARKRVIDRCDGVIRLTFANHASQEVVSIRDIRLRTGSVAQRRPT